MLFNCLLNPWTSNNGINNDDNNIVHDVVIVTHVEHFESHFPGKPGLAWLLIFFVRVLPERSFVDK